MVGSGIPFTHFCSLVSYSIYDVIDMMWLSMYRPRFVMFYPVLWTAIRNKQINYYRSKKLPIREPRTRGAAARDTTPPVTADSDADVPTASTSPLLNSSGWLRLRCRFLSVACEMVPRRLSLYFGNSLYSTRHTRTTNQRQLLCLFVCLGFNGTFNTNRLYRAITVG